MATNFDSLMCFIRNLSQQFNKLGRLTLKTKLLKHFCPLDTSWKHLKSVNDKLLANFRIQLSILAIQGDLILADQKTGAICIMNINCPEKNWYSL